MHENKTTQPANGSYKRSQTGLKADIKLEWKTIKEQLGIDLRRFVRFLRRLLINDKK
jgi:hypothetical protein